MHSRVCATVVPVIGLEICWNLEERIFYREKSNQVVPQSQLICPEANAFGQIFFINERGWSHGKFHACLAEMLSAKVY